MFRRSTPSIRSQNGIAILEKAQINGWEQWLLIRGQDTRNPILLFLHGGPGTAQIAWARYYQKRLEKHFVVVNWDQRGAGLSFSERMPTQLMTIDQFVEDVRFLTESLLERFQQNKVFIVGQSWGSIIGMRAVARYPDLFHAYAGVGQVACMMDNEEISYRFVMGTARNSGNLKAIRELESIGQPPYQDHHALAIQRRWLQRFKGTIHGTSLARFMLMNLLRTTEYKARDWVAWVKGGSYSLKNLWAEIMTVDFFNEVPELLVPVYFCLGRHDYTVPSELAEKYLQALTAPHKELIWFENSAHAPNVEEPEHFQDVLIAKLL
ncbi:MAG: alpha/beta fold hydrolase [Bacilli bacterium]